MAPMTDAARKILEAKLAAAKQELSECRAQLAGITERGTLYQRAREYWERRIQRALQQITEIEAELKTE